MTRTETVDRYPTRVPVASWTVDRRDPTVWPSDRTGPLDRDSLDDYATRGYTTTEALLSAREVLDCRAELIRLTRDPGLRGDERVVIEKSSPEIRSIFEVHRISPLIAELIRDPRIAGRARQILGSEVYVHQSRVNYMPAFTGTGFYWHSDFETWHAEDGMPAPRAMSMTLALTDNHPYNGGLMVMPGSHNVFVPCLGQTPAGHYKDSLREQKIGVPGQDELTQLARTWSIDQFTGPAGGALWFDSNLMHGSANNITPFPRWNIFVVFNSVANALAEPFAGTEPRPTFIASRDVTAVV